MRKEEGTRAPDPGLRSIEASPIPDLAILSGALASVEDPREAERFGLDGRLQAQESLARPQFCQRFSSQLSFEVSAYSSGWAHE